MASDSSNTITFQATPITKGGYPNLVDSNFLNSVTEGKKGGDSTQSFFDATNQTSDFWGWMASHDGTNTNPFVDATDSDGNPIVIASNGNVSMRMGAFYNDNADVALDTGTDDPPPVTAIGTIQTGNTTTMASRDISVAIGIVELPLGFKLTKSLWADLLGPIYNNMKTLVTKTAKQFQQATRTESPTIVADEESEPPVEDASSEIEPLLGEIAEEGAEYMTLKWGSAILDVAGLGAIAAIPLIVSYLGHKMINSLSVINQTALNFTWAIGYQHAGEPSVLPSADGGSTSSTIPQMEIVTDIWGDKSDVPVAYEADFQFINSSDYGSIGYVMSLTPSDGSTPAQLVISIPWAGENTIWVGSSDADPVITYNTNSATNGQLSTTAAFDTYQVTVSINALQGKTNDQYFYGVLVVIEPLS